MKWLRTLVLFDTGDVIGSADWQHLHDSYVRAIQSVCHPIGSRTLTLRRKMRKPTDPDQWIRNGVKPLREQFLNHMVDGEGWRAEGSVDLNRDRIKPPLKLYPSNDAYDEPITSDFGGFDFVTTADGGLRIAIEWETGNISSSHRSMNKLSIALASGVIDVGVLIVPSRSLYEHLTDRIGNIGELSGYLGLWEGLKSTVESGLLAVTVVEHDALTDDPSIPFLRMGKDGRAKEAVIRRRR